MSSTACEETPLSIPRQSAVHRKSASREDVSRLLRERPVILAPMEDVTDVVFRRLCRSLGAEITVTEFVNVEGLLRGCKNAKRKIRLADDDALTAIQIYGSDPERLAEAAEVAEEAEPLFVDINCGCWVPKIAGRGAGAGWLRDPDAMVKMVTMVASRVNRPVTVKTRIGYGPESHMPIVDLAARLEQTGIAALTIHCRTANMGHKGKADWKWAGLAKERVKMPIIVNGDVVSGETAEAAITSTGAEGVMVGRRAIEHPWVFREIHHRFATGTDLAPPTPEERFELCRSHLRANVEERGLPYGVRVTRRHLTGYLHGLPGAAALRQALFTEDSLDVNLELIDTAEARFHRAIQEGAGTMKGASSVVSALS